MPKKHPNRPYLLAWRRHLEKSQEWLAGELGTSHSTVLRWEKGQAGVDEKTFAEIARVYGITPAELSAHPNDASRSRELDRLWKAVAAMDNDGLHALATMAERLKPSP
jgi:transcriptional regulator with XRE-family HTH domain